jgi:cytochrome bd-type quinol oxidase subunit 2
VKAQNIQKAKALSSVVAVGTAFAQEITCTGTNCIGEGSESVSEDSPGLFEEGGVFKQITNIMLFLVGIISVIMLIVGGIRYVVSGGDQNAVQGAKNTILYAIIGIVVAFLAFAAVRFVTTNLNPSS